MSPEDLFQKALLAGAAASPFKGGIILMINGSSVNVPRCQVSAGSNKADHDEYGVELVYTISAHIPKAVLTVPPVQGRDAIVHKDRSYKVTLVDGNEDCSPFWILEGEAPV